MTDPSFARQLITFTTAHVGNYGISRRGLGERPRARGRRDHARGDEHRRRSRRTSRAGSTGWPSDGIPGDRRRRHPRAGAAHPLGGGDARRDLPGRDAGGRGDGARAGRAVDGRPRPRARGDGHRAARRGRGRERCGSSRSTPASSARSCATSSRAACSSSCSRARRRPTSCWHVTPTGSSSCPVRATRRRSTTSSTPSGRCWCASRCSGSASATSCCRGRRASRPSSCRSATAAPTTRSRTSRPAGSRSPPRTTVSRWRVEPGRRIESELGAAELTHVNLYDGTVEGFRLLDVPAACVQYHPEAGPGPNDSLGLFDLFVDEFDRAA